MTPYREASPVPDVDEGIPWYERMNAWLGNGERYQWYRRSKGGRWTLHWGYDLFVPEWRRVEECKPELRRATPAELTLGFCTYEHCECEIWP